MRESLSCHNECLITKLEIGRVKSSGEGVVMMRWVGNVHRGTKSVIGTLVEGFVEGKGLSRNTDATRRTIGLNFLLWFGTSKFCIDIIRSDGDLLSFVTTCNFNQAASSLPCMSFRQPPPNLMYLYRPHIESHFSSFCRGFWPLN